MVQQHAEEASIVCLTYEELLSGSCDLWKIEKGLGTDGLGIVTVSGVPGLLAIRHRLLLLAQKFADLPDEVKSKYEDPLGGLAIVGWSRGVEVLEDGRPDLHKGSYYANPLHDSVTTDPVLLKKFPSYTIPNVWPDEELPDFRPAFQELGRLIVRVGLLLAKQCDQYAASKLPNFPEGRLEGVLRRSLNPKGRLLHYYPTQPGESAASTWCAQHTDHGSLTGLLSALYTEGDREVTCPDPTAGLYITGRSGSVTKAPIPPSHLAFQVGEAMQVHSGGLLRATPHFVQTASGQNSVAVARNTFAVFLQPRWDEPMDLPAGASAKSVGIGQWREGITFGEFSELTLKKNNLALAPTA